MQGSSAFQVARAAYRAGLLSRRQLLDDALADLRFRVRGATDADSLALRERVAGSLAGVRQVELERLSVDVLAGILPRVYPEMLALGYAHQDAGRRVYIVTAAAQPLAATLARVMGFDGAIGSDLSEVIDGVFTGRATGVFVYRSGKAGAIEALAAREGVDLAASYAYSDSESDLPMLWLVGHPVAVNPDGALARTAREQGWEIVRLDRLGRRLKATAAMAGAAAAGGMASAALVRRRRPGLSAAWRWRLAGMP